MTTLSITATELRRIVLAVEKSAAKDDSRPALAGIHASVTGDRLTLAAADGFRLSTAYATLDESADDAAAILNRAALLAFAKSIKAKTYGTATIEVAADAWAFSANGTRASVQTIAATYPDFASIVGSGDEPVLFTVNPQFFTNVLASHGDTPVHVSRATDSASAPLFFTAGDGTRHVVMPMILGANDTAAWKRREEPAPVVEVAAEVAPASVDVPEHDDSRPVDVDVAAEVEVEPAPVAPEESAFRTQRAANERRLAKRAERRAAADAAADAAFAARVAHDAPTCATCGTHAEQSDNYCGECGSAFGAPAPVAGSHTWPAPVATPYALAAYSEKNQARILDQCPHASDVRGFHAWVKAGRVVRKGQKGIKIVAPVMGGDDGGKVVNIKPAWVFDVTQTDERTARAA